MCPSLCKPFQKCCIPINCLRCILFISSLFDMLFGGVFVGLGWYLIDLNEQYEVDDDDDVGQKVVQMSTRFLGYFLFALGAPPLAAGIFSCLGACCKNVCFLTLYFIIHTIGTLAFLVIVSFYDQIFQIGKDNLDEDTVPEVMFTIQSFLYGCLAYFIATDVFACCLMWHPKRKRIAEQGFQTQKIEEDSESDSHQQLVQTQYD